TTIAFDTPFAYNGTDNLALIVDDNTGGWVGNIDFRVFEAVNQSIYVNSDDINFTAAGLSGYVGTRGNSKNQVRFNAPDVPMLTSIDVTDITAHTALVTWESEGSLWNLQYRQGTSGAWTDVKGISSKSYALTNLDALTIYYVRVQIAGSPSDEGWTLTAFKTADGLHVPSYVEVSTTPTSATLSWEGNADSYTVSYRPYSGIIFYDDFENGLDAKGWTVRTLGDSPSGDGWFTMSPNDLGIRDANNDMIYAVSGSQVASAWSYYYGSVLDANNWLITPQVELKGTLRFMAVSNPLYLDSYEVLLSTTGNDTGDFTTVLRSMDVASGVWEPVSIDLSAFEGQQGYIAIHHVGVDKYVLFIDDFCISEGDADVATQQPWTGIGTTEKTLTIDGLWPATKYEYMITASGNGDMAETGIATFTTMESNPVPFDLAAVAKRTSATLSWTGFSDKYKVQYRKAAQEVATFFEDFEDLQSEWFSYVGAEGDGWQLCTYDSAISGNTVLASLSYDFLDTMQAVDADNWLISPRVDLGSTLKFWISSYNSYYLDSYEVWLSLSEEINYTEDFDIVLQPLQEAASEWTEVSIDLSAYQGKKGYIAIRHKSYDCYALLLDDFGIYASSGSQGEWKTITTKETEVTINGLEEETKYEFRVTGVKSGEADAVSDIASFSTRRPINLRMYADAEAMNSYRITANTRLNTLGGTSLSASSAPAERMAVRCFFLQTFTAISTIFGH
ncbi:MAG: choice-of-anchor J domain-containing protein, partial [Bacteroidaceae bacterium]|nr:choice-of-anchor J domain-containing protein [Bacteroidaceae bacterium]